MSSVEATSPDDLTQDDWMRVSLIDVHLNVRCGVHPWERHEERPNRIIVNVDMFSSAKLIADRSAELPIINYDTVREGLLKWEAREHVDYLETLVEDAIRLCFEDPRVQACKVSIVKPDIFNEAGGAGVEMYRRRTPGS